MCHKLDGKAESDVEADTIAIAVLMKKRVEVNTKKVLLCSV